MTEPFTRALLSCVQEGGALCSFERIGNNPLLIKTVFGYEVPRVHGSTDSAESILKSIKEEQAAGEKSLETKAVEIKEEVTGR